MPEADNVRPTSDEESGEEGEEGEEDSADDEDGKDTQAKESAESTMSKVLAIPELLENVLSFLPEREILTSVERVSQTWRAAIFDSPLIQRRLFSPEGNNPAALPAWFSTIDPLGGRSKRFQRFGIPMYKGPMTTNGLFKKNTGRDGMEEVDDLYLYKSCDLRLMDGFESSREAPGREDRYMRYSCLRFLVREGPGSRPQPATSDSPGLSWRSMQLCDPPIGVANLRVRELDYRLRDPVQLYATILDKDRGITMGLVHDTIAAMIRSHFRQGASDIDWSSHVSFGIEGCDGGNTTDSPDRDGGDIDGEGFSEQDDADEVEENDEGDGSNDDDTEDDSVHQEDLEEDKISEYDGEAVDL